MSVQISLYTLLANTVSLDEAIQLTADAGFDAIDIRQREDGIHITHEISDAEALTISHKVEDAGLHVSGLTTYWEIGRVERDSALEQLDGLYRSMEVACALGASFVRVSSGDYKKEYSYEVCRAAFREQMMTVAEVAAEMDLVITPEQHGGRYIASAGQVMDMCRGLEHPNLGIVFDPGNSVSEGFERPWVQVRMMGGWIKQVHVKNRMTAAGDAGINERLPGGNCKVNEGVLNWDLIADELAAIGYCGYLICEDFAEFPSLAEKFAWNADFLRGLAEKFE